MVGLLLHVLYLLGKCIYDRYRVKRTRLLPDVANEAELFRYDYDTFDDVSEFEDTCWWTHRTINNFFPPAYIQRYCAVTEVLSQYKGKLSKVVDFGCAELSFLVYLKGIPEVEEILCVDVDREVLERNERKAAPLITEMMSSRERKLTIEICEGSVTDNDIKLKHANAVICIELIEHLYPDTLIDLPFNIFGYIKPEVVIMTTPNVEFNVVFPNMSGYRHPDHKFEWTREQFQDWAQNIVVRYPYYSVTFQGICNGPEGTEELGAVTQMAVFHRILPRNESRIEIIMPDEYIKLRGQHALFNTIAKYEYSTGQCDNRSDERKILDEATYYIHYLNDINDNEDTIGEVHLTRILEFMSKYTVSLETLRSILTDAGWSVVDRENGPAVLLESSESSDEMSNISNDYSNMENDDWDNEYENSRDDDLINMENIWDYETGERIGEIYVDAGEVYGSRQNLHIEESNVTSVNDASADGEYLSVENPFIENWHEEPSIIIPENCSINQENTYLYDGENSLVEESHLYKELRATCDDSRKRSAIRNTAESLIYTERELPSDSISLTLNEIEVETQVIASDMPSAPLNDSLQLKISVDNITAEPAPLQSDQINLAATKGVTSMLNFQPRMSVSRSSTSPTPLYFNSEMNSSLQDFNYYQNESTIDQLLINNQCLLNSTFHQSDIATETVVTSVESILGDTSCFKESLPKKDIRGSEINFSLHMPSNHYNCSVEQGRGISDKNQICEDNDMADVMSSDAYSNFNHQPKYTSSPHTKTPTTNIVNKSLKYRELIPAMNSNVLPDTTEEIKETVSDTSDSSSLEANQKSNNSIAETIKPYATSSGSGVTNISRRDVDCSANSSTQQKLCLENKDFSGDNFISSELIQDTNREFAKNNRIDHESDIADDTRTVDAHHDLSLGNESINRKGKSVYCTLAKTDVADTDAKEHLENAISDLAQSSVREKRLIPPRDLLSLENYSESQSVSKYSSSDCAKETNVLRNDRFVPCTSSEDTSNVNVTSVLKNEEVVGTSKDISNIAGLVSNVEAKPSSPLETPPNSWSPEIMDSGYPNSASAQDITPEYELPSIAQDYIPDSESPSVAEAPRLGVLEPVEVENGDLANNNRDDEGNNMMAVDANDIENLQPLIDVLENDLENENDIYVMQNGFPIWLLRILDMANPLDFDMQARQNLRIPNEVAGANYVGHDEGFDSSSESENDVAYNEMENDNGHDK